VKVAENKNTTIETQAGKIINKNKEERFSRVHRLSDTRYSAKGTKGSWRNASYKARL